MRTPRVRRPTALAVVGLLLVGLLLVACSDGGSGTDATGTGTSSTTTDAVAGTTIFTPSSTSSTTSRSGATTTTRVPVRGGTLVLGMPTVPVALDPVVAVGDGDAGGTELLAIYDSLARFDPDTGTYQPRLAEAIVPNAEHTAWSIALRPGVTFSDGTPFDAVAVKFGIDRYRAGAPGAPACDAVRACAPRTSAAGASSAFVRDVTVTAPLTLTVTLTVPWVDFPWLLATEVGMIPSPTALLAACPADPAARPADCAFVRAPVGAGPFAVAAFVPGASLLLQRNQRYWGPAPPLDGVRVVATADQGGVRALDALLTGAVDAAYLRDPQAVRAAVDKRLAGRTVVQHAGSVEVMNLAGPATRYLRVRLALAAAIDPGVVAERVTGARHEGDGDLVGRTTDLWPRTNERTYDPELARRLVAEARANGWDGTVRYVCDNSAAGRARGIALETMLKAAGIDPVIDTTRDAAAVSVLRDATATAPRPFDLVCDGFTNTADPVTGAADGSTLASLTDHLSGTGVANRSGWQHERADAALLALRAARTDNDRRAAVRTLVEVLRADPAFVVTGARTEQLAWSSRVQGIVGTAGSRVLLDRAFLVASR